jgi:hypothetical protein
MDKSNTSETRNVEVSKTRLIIGGILFAGGFLSPLAIPLVTQSDLPGNWKVFLSTGLVAGLPEVGMVLAAAVLGKQGFALLKEKLFSLLRKHTAPAAVSAGRYRIGLFMFLFPLVVGWLTPYAAHFFPVLAGKPLLPAIIFDLVFAASFLVLGAGFWEKIRSLFVHDESAGAGTPSS